MIDPKTCYLDLLDVSRRIQAGEITSVELTRTLFERIDAVDARLHSYATVMRDQAMAAAERCDEELQRGKPRSALHGVPVAVKDLLWTTDAPTMHGMPLHRAFVAPEDATTVRRLRDAGAVILGKLQMTEGAYGAHHPDVRSPVNPWDSELWPGVSSSGPGVATAAGLCYASLGTDTGGSIRYPNRREAYGPVLVSLLEAGRDINAMDHQKREAQRQDYRGRLNGLFAEVDLLLAPVTHQSGLTNAQVDAALAEEDLRVPLQRYTTPFNLSGHPSITLPGGRTPDGSPIGLQFIGRHFGEDLLVRAGWAYQQATSWHRERPAL